MKRLQVYLRELAFACHEASVSDDPRVVALCLALVERAGEHAKNLAVRDNHVITSRRYTLKQGETRRTSCDANKPVSIH